MKIRRSIQIKAAFLLTVFSLNTLIGFACAIGIDMGFNTSHHHDEEANEAVVHTHKNGTKHVHHDEAGKHHDEVSNHKDKSDKDDCCNDKVIKITQLDKAVPRSISAINPGFFTISISFVYNIDPLFTSRTTSIKYFVRGHHPPIPDIRIAIQSFQI
ncbi:MAG: hypothetical protein ABIO55_13980 [Ginsengibacter sp.]